MFCLARESLGYVLLHGPAAWLSVGAGAGVLVGYLLRGRRA